MLTAYFIQVRAAALQVTTSTLCLKAKKKATNANSPGLAAAVPFHRSPKPLLLRLVEDTPFAYQCCLSGATGLHTGLCLEKP